MINLLASSCDSIAFYALTANVSRADTKNTRSSASFGTQTFNSFTKKSMQRS